MIITLTGADFSNSNIGVLTTWSITKTLGTGASYSGPTTVDRGAALSATVTIADGYEIATGGVTITMGGTAVSAATVSDDGLTVTISIAEVTGNVNISVPTAAVSNGDEPTETVWYVDHRANAASLTMSVNIAGRGWTHGSSGDAYNAYVGKPVNALGFFTTIASQSVVIGTVPLKGTVDDMTVIATATATSSGSAKEFTYVTFPTVTLAEGECLVAFAQDDTNINFYYAQSAVTDANGIVDTCFYGRVPKVYGSGDAWTTYTSNMCVGWSVGYVV